MSSPCHRCAAALGRSCCEVEAGEPLATLTAADVERVEAATGWRAERFVEDEWLGWEDVLAYERRRPLYRGYFRNGPRRLTLRRAAGACVFFAPGQGCTLSTDARPTACRLYPLDLTDAGTFGLQVDRFPTLAEAREARGAACLAVQEASDWPELAALFQMDEAQVHALAARLRLEVEAHSRGTGTAGGARMPRRP